jgi:probable HAF family extracellular repeat protein
MNRGLGRRLARCVAPVLLVMGWLGSAEAAPPEGTPLMFTLPPEALAYGVGVNGFVIVGTFFSGGSFYWMPTSGVTSIGGTQAAAVSRDGRTIVGNELDDAGHEQAAIWTGGTTWRLLGSVGQARPCDRLVSGAFGANDDGRVVVGLAWDGCSYARAFRWEESTGMVDLGRLGARSSRANGVSGDGRVVVGWDEATTGFRRGAKWVDGTETVIQGPSGDVGEAFAANPDGSLIVGTNCDPMDYHSAASAWTWRPNEGVQCSRIDVPGWLPDFPYQLLLQNTSDDGRVMGGALSFGLDAESVVWFDGEPVLLRDYLRSHGLPEAFEGWVNTGFVTDVSADGRTLVGFGAGPRTFQGFVVILPELGDK